MMWEMNGDVVNDQRVTEKREEAVERHGRVPTVQRAEEEHERVLKVAEERHEEVPVVKQVEEQC